MHANMRASSDSMLIVKTVTFGKDSSDCTMNMRSGADECVSAEVLCHVEVSKHGKHPMGANSAKSGVHPVTLPEFTADVATSLYTVGPRDATPLWLWTASGRRYDRSTFLSGRTEHR
jgi:hypothetical protein